MSTEAIDEVVRRAAARGPVPNELAAPPAMQLAVVTCMDARIVPSRHFGIAPGDAHVIRTAGALATPAVVHAVGISQEYGGTREVMVVHHTDCVALGALHPGMSPQESVAQAVAVLRSAPDVPHRDAIRGFVLDVATGALTEVDAPG